MANDVLVSPYPSPSAGPPRWRHRVRGALLASACADGVCQALPPAATPTSGEIEGFTSPHSRSELEFGPITARTVVLAYQLLRRYGAVADPAAAPAQSVLRTVDHIPAAWITAVGLQGAVPFAALAAQARQVAAMAGADGLVRDVAAAQAIAVAVAVRRLPDEGRLVDCVITHVGAHCGTPTLRDTAQLIGSLVRHRADPDEVAGHFTGHDPQVASFAAALHAFLTHPDDPRQAAHRALRQARVDSGAAVMAAALAGARVGDDYAPHGWGSRLRHSRQIWAVGGDLANHAGPGARVTIIGASDASWGSPGGIR